MAAPPSPRSFLKHRISIKPLSPHHRHDDLLNLNDLMVVADFDKGGRTVTWAPSFMQWTRQDVFHVATHHWLPSVCGACLLFFMGVEYTLSMVPPLSPPFDFGFIATRPLHRLLSSSPDLNTFLAFLNTMFVGMQTTYILWTWLIEGRPRATISALFMFTCRGILGYSTQLPVPEGFLGSGVDFPVGNVSFFLFFSGHVAGSVIASLDMRRVRRQELAWLFDALNVLQVIRLLGTRGHYTIDLAAGLGAGVLFDGLAGKYEERRKMGVKDKKGEVGIPDGHGERK
ncbi:hypothetical protein MLD38_004930 [Melastoma candidum]|uniref:Uncharacterized protein n=1 Tax=Melastoma candidum TaxID=119954 RepID=A0ACB9S7P8_9MYRT|nr:hypothetical protein MLD38_004930 [Melastoma candidum]